MKKRSYFTKWRATSFVPHYSYGKVWYLEKKHEGQPEQHLKPKHQWGINRLYESIQMRLYDFKLIRHQFAKTFMICHEIVGMKCLYWLSPWLYTEWWEFALWISGLYDPKATILTEADWGSENWNIQEHCNYQGDRNSLWCFINICRATGLSPACRQRARYCVRLFAFVFLLTWHTSLTSEGLLCGFWRFSFSLGKVVALYSRFDVIVCRLTCSPLFSMIMLQQITFICTKRSLKLVSSAFTWTEFGCTEKLQQPEHDDAGGHSEPLVLHWGGAEVLPSRDPRNHHWSDRWGWGSSFL